jgi:hypothetical protein
MDITSSILTIAGLALFESITSIDNAIINAEVLTTMNPRARRWFLTWGIGLAVLGVRGLLPWLIVWVIAPGLGPLQAFTATLTGDPAALRAIRQSAPVLLIGGGVFFIFLFCHWLFLEPKKFGLPGESFFARQGAWFYAVVSVFLMVIVWYALEIDPMLAFGAVVGSTAFFITHGFRRHAETQEDLSEERGHVFDPCAGLRHACPRLWRACPRVVFPVGDHCHCGLLSPDFLAACRKT